MGFANPARRTTLLLATLLLLAAGDTAAARGGSPHSAQAGSQDGQPFPSRVNLKVTVPRGAPPRGLRRPVARDTLRAMRTFLERVDVTATGEGVPVPGAGPRGVGRVAASLADWQEAHRLVRDRVRHVPYAGSVRGAAGALETRAANSLDQALLLRELLDARGVEARLVRGRLDWPEASRLVLGAAEPGRPVEGDPWPRWVEIVADHWWVEAEIEGRRVSLDPSFPDAAPGTTPGLHGTVVDPESGVEPVRLQVGLFRGDVTLAEAELSATEMVGQVIELELSPTRSGGAPGGPGEIRREATAGATVTPVDGRVAPATPRGAAVTRSDGDARWKEPLVVPDRWTAPRGPWTARLRLPERTYEAGPLEVVDLPNLELRLRVETKHGPAQRLRVPWGGHGHGRITVVVGSGPVAAERLAAAARPLYQALQGLARAEVGARDALRPPQHYWAASEGLRQATEIGWQTLGREGPAALGWALLRALDELHAHSSSARVLRPGLRLVGVRWRPPRPGSRPALELTLEDPVVVGQVVAGLSPRRLQSAYGLLQSAVVSQVLHELVGDPPLTAFDVTLRAVGTGVGMGWFRSVDELPRDWTEAARATAADGMAGGHVLVAPRQPASGAASSEGWGWWQVGPGDGRTTGRVLGPAGGEWHGRVEMAARGWTDLDGMLGSLPDLHRGLRWLGGIGGADGTVLQGISASACASAALAGSTLGRAAPPSWPVPAVEAYCGPRRVR